MANPAKPRGGNGSTEHLKRYFETLGLKPGAPVDEISTTYYTLIKRFPENPTEEEEARLHEIRHAYDLLRRAYVPAEKKVLAELMHRRLLVPVLSVLTVLAIGVLVAMNYSTIKLKMTHYENGAVLRLKNQSEPYGQIVGYEARHLFPEGNPSAAYSIRLAGQDETVWVSERLVVNGMVPASSN
jgi:hypothetical protein